MVPARLQGGFDRGLTHVSSVACFQVSVDEGGMTSVYLLYVKYEFSFQICGEIGKTFLEIAKKVRIPQSQN